MREFLSKIRVAVLGNDEADVLFSLMGGYLVVGVSFLIYAAGVR